MKRLLLPLFVNTNDMEWNESQLTEFIVEASRNTYADPNAKTVETPYRPGCEEYLYESGDWRYLDSYAWIRDGGGEEVVYFKGKPVWVMNYYGYIVGNPDTKAVYASLHRALALRHAVLPVRGSKLEEMENGLRYEVVLTRTEIGNFIGSEQIFERDTLVYEAYFHGGFVR